MLYNLRTIISIALLTASVLMLSATALAGPEDFTKGPVIESFGENAVVMGATPIAEGTVFKLSYDVSASAAPGKVNRNFNTVARFINMHARAGVPVDDIRPAIIVHGKAVFDLTNPEFYGALDGINPDGKDNANIELVAALIRADTRIIVCGQSAAYHGVPQSALLPDVEIAVSAMTAHVLLQQDGYALNPF